ncbi:hypothetical protein [uncultured Vibrio sp.]|uniref:hypothetical protein n=1 Tax=uncultured Vibrio sp. TaxID=114054 RepID=UPI0025DF85AE|nr:hypothetical protein [uncultured Vibrio sp.]
MELSNEQFEQVKEIIAMMTSKDFFDYCATLGPMIVGILAIYWSYKTVEAQAKLLKDEKLFSKDVDKIYEALDLLFEYFNATNLFYSLNEKEFNKLLKGNVLSVKEGLSESASDEMRESISQFKRASFLMKALGQESISANLDVYHSETIVLRKQILGCHAKLNKNDDEALDIVNAMLTGSSHDEKRSYADRVAGLNQQFNACVKEIVEYKESLKDKSKE